MVTSRGRAAALHDILHMLMHLLCERFAYGARAARNARIPAPGSGQAGRRVAQTLASGPARVIVILTMTRRSRRIASR